MRAHSTAGRCIEEGLRRCNETFGNVTKVRGRKRLHFASFWFFASADLRSSALSDAGV
jgi:hypothetical protein